MLWELRTGENKKENEGEWELRTGENKKENEGETKLERLLERGRVGAGTKLTHIEMVEGNWGKKASHP